MANTILIVLLILQIIVLFVLAYISIKVMVIGYVIANATSNQERPQPEQPSNHTDLFRSGLVHLWMLTQLSLYKMYTENYLIDFDGTAAQLNKELSILSNNQGELVKWQAEYNKYLASKANSGNDRPPF